MAVLDSLDLEEVMSRLALRRPVFHSEADFQFALATILHELNPKLEIRLEIPQSNGITLDMLLIDPVDGEHFAIELKYKTALWSGHINGESYLLKNHGADDIGSYDILKDVSRIESLVQNASASSGTIIVLTNEPLYWKVRTLESKVTNAHEFRIHEGLLLSGTRAWGPRTGGSNKGREHPLTLSGNYPIVWKKYSEVGGSRGSFRQLVFRVGF